MRVSNVSDNAKSYHDVIESSDNIFHANGELEAELADAKLLHKLSIELIQEDGITALYEKIVKAGLTLMRSQFATMQMLYPNDSGIGKLRLLASSGLSIEAQKYWEWVYPGTPSTCGELLKTGKRVIVPDYRMCSFVKDGPTLPLFLEAGIVSAQSTPLISRTGKLVGAITTHWRYPYTPPQAHLELFEILARQASDLIERQQTADALKKSEERLQALSNATNDVVYRMSPDWSSMWELQGRNFLASVTDKDEHWMQKYILPEDWSTVKTSVDFAVQNKSDFQLEHRMIKANGSIGWVLSRAIPLLGLNGEVVEWLGAATDITEKKSFLLNLEHLVDERTKELKRSNEDLQQFAHVASHDLKEPVRKIRTFGLRLQNELKETLNDNSSKYTEKILESASRMTAMIEGVLSYSSVNNEDFPKSTINLNKILSEICNDLEMQIEAKHAIIEYDALPEIEGVSVLIHQLFYNLINNSLKFSKDSERPVIYIEAGEDFVDGRAYSKITVKDNGIGFDPNHNALVFEPFSRLNLRTRYEGTGLGLSLSKKIVERHGGLIEASGSENVGAVFTMRFPAKE